MQRVTGVSRSSTGQSVFVRGLGERYSNTTLAGATLPTTEPDRRVVPLDLFPHRPHRQRAGQQDLHPRQAVAVRRRAGRDRAAEAAGFDLLRDLAGRRLEQPHHRERWGLGYPGGGRDWTGFDDGTRSLPAGFPDRKVTRGGRFSGDELGLPRSERPRAAWRVSSATSGIRCGETASRSNQSYSATLFGGRFGKLGVVATFRHSPELAVHQRAADLLQGRRGAPSSASTGPTTSRSASVRGLIGGVGNIAYQFTPNQRLSFDNFYTHVGTNETRIGSRVTTTTPATTSGTSGSGGSRSRSRATTWAATTCSPRSRTAGSTGSSPSRAPTARSRTCARCSTSSTPPAGVRSRRRVPERTAAVQRPRGRQPGGEQRELERRSSSSGAASPRRSSSEASYIDRQPRLPVPPAPLRAPQPHRGEVAGHETSTSARVPAETDLHAGGGALHRPTSDIFQLKEETRGTDRYDAAQEVRLVLRHDRRAAGGRSLAWSPARASSTSAGRRDARPVRGHASTSTTADVRSGRRSTRPTSSRPSTSSTPCGPTRTSGSGYSQTVNRPEFREVSPFEFTDVVGGRAIDRQPRTSNSR